jgi:regulator of replication initiation timing
MRGNGCQRILFKIYAAAGAWLLCAALSSAQQSANAPQSRTLPADASAAVQALTDSLRDLQEQVRQLNAQLKELRDEQKDAAAEVLALRAQLTNMRRTLAEPPQTTGLDSNSSYSRSQALNSSNESSTAQSNPAPGPQLPNQRLARLEENQDVTAANVRELSQTKVESGSKYRLRLSGIVLLNMFENRGTVDNLDMPQVALPTPYIASAGAFGGTLRQSQIGLDAFGPDVAGAHTSASLMFDFAGGFVATQNGAAKPLVRLRTGTVRLDWADTSIVAGQDSLFFVPLSPSSLASLAMPALAYAGDLWNWSPQIRVEHRIHFENGAHLLLQAGIMDSLSGDVAVADFERYPTWGERSGQPAYAGRVGWSHPAFGQELTFGVGGYYGRQDWGFGRNVDAWAGTFDMDLPLGKFFDLSAAFYRGRSVGGLGGGIGQSILTTGPFGNPTTIVHGLDSAGGWAQLKFKPRTNFEVNGALGEDNPFASQLDRFPGSPAYYGTLLSRNLSPLVNFIYQPRSDVLFSAEYRHLQTFVLNSSSQKASLVNLSLGYTF